MARAAEIALAEGLEIITLRRIADDLGVRPGLVGHYFPVAEDLTAEAFGVAATAELESLLPGEGDGDPTGRLVRFLSLTGGDTFDGMSRLWLNARHLSRYRASLRERVEHQEEQWSGRLSALISEGVAAGQFRCADPWAAAVWILIVLDGLGTHASTHPRNQPEVVATMTVVTAERELGLAPGTLSTLMTKTWRDQAGTASD